MVEPAVTDTEPVPATGTSPLAAFDPAALAAVAATVDISSPSPSSPDVVVDAIDGAKCPFPSLAAAGGSRPTTADGTVRTPADMFVRRLLRVPDKPVDLSDARVYRTFQRSMLISAVRCTLTYVIFPFVLPGIGFMKGVGPLVGIVIGSIALACDTFTIRRFFVADHKWRWHFSAIAFAIMCLLTVLLVQDVAHVIGNLIG